MTRRALVLSSGGARGSFEVGVIEELVLNRGLDFHIFCGVSAGALNASVLAQAAVDADPATSLRNLQADFRLLREMWLERITGTDSVIRQRLLGIAGLALNAESVYTVEPLKKLLSDAVDPQRLAHSGRDLRVQYVALETAELQTVLGSGKDILDGILASASIPVFFPPVIIDNQHLVDGGVRDNTPLSTAFAAEPPPDIIYVVYASPRQLEPAEYQDSLLGFRVGARDYLMRTIEILLNEIDITDVDGARQLNTLKRHWQALRPSLPDNESVRAIDKELGPIRFAPLVECRPERLIVKDGMRFEPAELRENYEYGKTVAAQLPREEDLL